MFNATYGAGQTKTGHGIYTEEAGAKLDWIHLIGFTARSQR